MMRGFSLCKGQCAPWTRTGERASRATCASYRRVTQRYHRLWLRAVFNDGQVSSLRESRQSLTMTGRTDMLP